VRGPRAEEADALHIHVASTIAVRLVFQDERSAVSAVLTFSV
jgi:hypothetical protein